MGSTSAPPTPAAAEITQEAQAVTNEAPVNLANDVASVVQAVEKAGEQAAPAVSKALEDVKAEGHAIADAIKFAVSQDVVPDGSHRAKIHELVDQIKQWIEQVLKPPPVAQ